MAKENYDEVIDQKLSELYDVLKALNTLKEKTTAVQDVVRALAAAGKGRVSEIESAVGRLGDGIKQSIAEVGKSMSAVAEKVNSTVEKAGKERTESIRITAETFSQSLNALVQAANDGASRMAKVVAELRGLPFVAELREMRQESVRQVAELKTAVDSVDATVKLIPEGIGKAQSGIKSSREAVAEGFVRQEKLRKDGISRVLNAVNDLSIELKKESVSIDKGMNASAQKILAALSEVEGKFDEGIGHLKNAQKTDAKKLTATVRDAASALSAEVVKTRNRITVFGFAVLVAVIAVGAFLAPAGIAAWKMILK